MQNRERRKEMRLYVIGPVSGFDDLNKPAFVQAHKILTHNGYSVLIPHDFVSMNADWQAAMKRSIETMMKCDGVAMLEGCERSFGALLEQHIAVKLGIPCYTVSEWASGIVHVPQSYEQKRCPHCKRILPLTLFSKSASSKDGRQTYCRDCMNGYKRSGKVQR